MTAGPGVTLADVYELAGRIGPPMAWRWTVVCRPADVDRVAAMLETIPEAHGTVRLVASELAPAGELLMFDDQAGEQLAALEAGR